LLDIELFLVFAQLLLQFLDQTNLLVIRLTLVKPLFKVGDLLIVIESQLFDCFFNLFLAMLDHLLDIFEIGTIFRWEYFGSPGASLVDRVFDLVETVRCLLFELLDRCLERVELFLLC